MKDKKNPVFITYFNPKGLFNHQGVRLDTIGVATVLKENGKISHGLSIKSSLDKMNRKRGSDTAIGKAFSKTPCIEYPLIEEKLPEGMSLDEMTSKSPLNDTLKFFHKQFVQTVQSNPEYFIALQAEMKKRHLAVVAGVAVGTPSESK